MQPTWNCEKCGNKTLATKQQCGMCNAARPPDMNFATPLENIMLSPQHQLYETHNPTPTHPTHPTQPTHLTHPTHRAHPPHPLDPYRQSHPPHPSHFQHPSHLPPSAHPTCPVHSPHPPYPTHSTHSIHPTHQTQQTHPAHLTHPPHPPHPPHPTNPTYPAHPTHSIHPQFPSGYHHPVMVAPPQQPPPGYHQQCQQPMNMQHQPVSYEPQQIQHSTIQQSTGVDQHPHCDTVSGKLAVGSSIDYQQNSKYRDRIWALLWIFQLICVVVVFVINFDNIKFSDGISDTSEESAFATLGSIKQIVIIIVVVTVLSLFIGALWLAIMKRYALIIIKLMLSVVAILHVLFIIIAFSSGSTIGTILAFVFLVFFLVYAYYVRHRMAFATAMLQMATQALQDYNAPIYIAFGMALVELAWSIFWILIVIGIQTRSGMPGVIMFFLFVSFYWTSEVIVNIVHVTACGVAAVWYYNTEPKHPARGAFTRATTTSLGSICLGSLIMAIVKAIRAMVELSRKGARDNEICLCLIDCIVGCIQQILEYFNVYAFTQVAIYNSDFITAAKDTFKLFKTTLFDAVINDDLTGFVMFLGSFVGGLIAGLVAYVWGNTSSGIYQPFAVGVLCFFVGFFVVALIMTVVRSNVATFFVLFAEDPMPLSQTHPDFYDNIQRGISELHGHAYDQQSSKH